MIFIFNDVQIMDIILLNIHIQSIGIAHTLPDFLKKLQLTWKIPVSVIHIHKWQKLVSNITTESKLFKNLKWKLLFCRSIEYWKYIGLSWIRIDLGNFARLRIVFSTVGHYTRSRYGNVYQNAPCIQIFRINYFEHGKNAFWSWNICCHK